jgi:dipeptidyl aminopeptidase/acylaminoacyl peptidase
LAWRTGVPLPLYRLVWRDESGAELGAVGPPAGYTNPALSPDGQRLAVDIREPGAKARDIWIFNLARGSRARFTTDPADDLDATWSPDGSRIAFSSDRKGTRHLYVKPADGSDEEALLFETPGDQNAEWWSPDGRDLIYNQQFQGGSLAASLGMLPMAPGAAPQPATLIAGIAGIAGSQSFSRAQISPDGKFIAYRALTPMRSVIYVQEFPLKGPKWHVGSETADQPQWRRDGRALYYLEQTTPASVTAIPFMATTDTALMAVDVDTAGARCSFGRPRKLFEFKSAYGPRNTYLAGPGNRLLVVEREPDPPRAPITVLVNWQAALEQR